MRAVSSYSIGSRSVGIFLIRTFPVALCCVISMMLSINLTLAALQEAGNPPTSDAAETESSEPFKRKIVREGIAIEFTMEHVYPQDRQSGEFREGDDVIFRLAITDTATDAPVTNAYPAAWLNLRSEGETMDAETCVKMAETFIGGSLFGKATLDLNVYYVLALNQDATITVVDPLFGFGTTKLLTLIVLKTTGEDWVLTTDQAKLFVSMPDSDQVAVVETASWQVQTNLDVGPRPTRLALQPDEYYLWVVCDASGDDSGVVVFTSKGLELAARIPTGRGHHEITFSGDSHFAFVTNADEGTVSVIDVRKLEKIKDIKTGLNPTSIAHSSIAQMVYVAHQEDGTIAVIDEERHEVVTTIQAEPGLGQIRFAPDGRLGFVVNPDKDVVHILDAATSRIVQTGDMEDEPYQVAFSDRLAYVQHRGSETVLMIPLAEVGVEGTVVPVVDFPGGQHPVGQTSKSSSADAIVPAPGGTAVLIANPLDKTIYFYQEGMAAPMGNFSNYDREPRAVLVVDRSLQERSSPGVYETVAKLREPGIYDVVLFLDTPRMVHCFEVGVGTNPELEEKRNARQVNIEPLLEDRIVQVGKSIRLPFKLTDPNTNTLINDLQDVNILTFLSPGIWHKRQWAQETEAGIYAIDFVPPESGIYYVYLECQSLGLTFNNPQYIILEATTSRSIED